MGLRMNEEERNKFIKDLEKLGHQRVHELLLSGYYNIVTSPIVEAWLKAQENKPIEPKFNLKQYFLDKIIPVLIPPILTFFLGLYIRGFEVVDLKKKIDELKHQMPEIPVTVIDPATKNQLYIGRPIPRPTHYEFPITLNDGQGSYRIDQYRWFNDFKGVLIIQKGKFEPSNPNE